MLRSVPPLAALVFAVVVGVGAHLVAAPRRAPQQPQAQPTFKSSVTLVPIDVRVLDRDGKPVLDLKREDFTIFEDAVRQPITHFYRQVLSAEPAGPSLRASSDVPAFDASPQNHRIFLIVVGAGAFGSRPLVDVSPSGAVHGANTKMIADPSKAIDGLLHMLRDRLLPQDQVALLAYNRATDFSADHESIAKLLEAFKESPEAGSAALARQNAIATVQSPEDPVFAVSPGSQTEDLGFAEYVQARNARTGDLENLRYGIRYLRYMQGEKHLIYVTAGGMVQSLEMQPAGTRADPRELAAAASDARVALHSIQTGGISPQPGPFLSALPIMMPRILMPGVPQFGISGAGSPGRPGAASEVAGASSGVPGGGAKSVLPQPAWDGRTYDPPVAIPGMSAMGLLALGDLRTMAELTGGHASIMQSAADAVDRIDEQTRVDYLLAYYPSNPVTDGRYRNVKVEVNRPDVQVLFRHGYHAQQQVAPITRRAVVTDGRLAAAGASAKEIRQIGLTVTPTFTRDTRGKGGEMVVRMVIEGSRLGWTTDDLERHVTHLDVAVYCGDAGERIVGQTRRALNLALTDERFAEVTAQGLPYSVKVPLTAPARFLKVIVYNYDANLLTHTIVRIK